MTGHDPVIPAGGSGKLTATISTHPMQQGKMRKSIRVETDDPGARHLMLIVSADLQPPVLIEPRPPVTITIEEGHGAEKRLLLHRQDGRPLEVTKVVSRDPSVVEARASVVTRKEKMNGLTAQPGDVWLDLTVPQVKGRTFVATQVSVDSTTPNLPQLMVPVYVRIHQLIEVIPPQERVVLPPQGGRSLVRLVRLRRSGGKPFKVLSAKSDRPDLFSAHIDNEDASPSHTVRIEISERVAQKRLDQAIHGQIEVHTDVPERRTVAIPVEIMRVRAARRPSPGFIRGVRGSRVPTPQGGAKLKGGPPGTPTPVGAPVVAGGAGARAQGGR